MTASPRACHPQPTLGTHPLPHRRSPMRTLAATLAAAASAAAPAVLPAGPVLAAPVDKENFVDSFTSDPYDCDGLVMAQDTGTVHVIVSGTLHGNSAFPYFTESDHGRIVTTNLVTGGTFTQVFSNNFH